MPGHKALAQHVLSWVTCAERPLAKSEVQHAWAVRESDGGELDQDSIPDVDQMVSVCCGLVIIDDKSHVIRLVHFTAQDYFEQTLTKWFPNAHLDIANTCASYLCFQPFLSGWCNSLFEWELRRESNPLFSYAAQYRWHHARLASCSESDAIIDFLEQKGPVQVALQSLYFFSATGCHIWGLTKSWPRDQGAFHLVCILGLDSILQAYLTTLRTQTRIRETASEGHH